MSPQPTALPSLHATLRPGDVIDGRYRIEEVLGAGGMAAVYRARHLGLGHVVAVKIASSVLSSVPGMVTRFVQEARAATQLKTEHVAHVYDVGSLPSGVPYMVMEHLDGRDLKTVLENEAPLEVEDAVDYALQCCEALAEVHGLGMVHRDIKPANLFLLRGSDGLPFVKLIDFGISRATSLPEGERLTAPQVVMGSPPYMAPEQIQGSSDLDARADVWSLGVVLYELLTGALPFEGESLVELLLAQTTMSPVKPSVRRQRDDIPAGLDAVILACLTSEPDERIPNVVELADALVPFGGSRAEVRAENVARTYSATTGEAQPITRITKRVRTRPRTRTKVAASVFVLATLGAGLAWFWSPSIEARPATLAAASTAEAPPAPPSQAVAPGSSSFEPPAVVPVVRPTPTSRPATSPAAPVPTPQVTNEPIEKNLFEYRN